MGIVEANIAWKGKETPDHANCNQEKDGTDLDLKINPEFEKLIPPLSRGEEMDLQRSLRNEGCRDALIIWDGTIVDGHNRYKYCKEKGIAFRVIERHFKDETTAKVWIIDNQLARRNLTKGAKISLESIRKDILSDEAKKRQGERKDLNDRYMEALDNKDCVKNIPPNSAGSYGDVRDQIAESAGVGHNLVDKFHYIEKHAPEKAKALCIGNYDDDGKKISINSVYKDLKEKERIQKLWDDGNPVGKYAIAYVNNVRAEKRSLLVLKEFLQDDALVFLWATVGDLHQRIALLNDVGFKYNDLILWDHVDSLLWPYTDNHYMFLLIGVKGDSFKYFLPKYNKLPSIVTKKRENIFSDVDIPFPPHEEFKALIHGKYPDVEKLDYFGSQAMDGWDIYRKPLTVGEQNG